MISFIRMIPLRGKVATITMSNYLGLDIGIAVSTVYDDDGFPGIQVDSYGEQQSGTAPYDHHSPLGILSRPHDPDTDDNGNPLRGCTVLYGLDGGKGHAWLSHDPRTVPLLPPLKKGGLVCYGGKQKNPAFIHFDGETGSQTFYVPYSFTGDTPGKSMSIEINVDEEGKESISLVHGNGMSITMIAGGKNSVTIKNAVGDAYMEVNDDGAVINGQLTVNGGFNAGGPGAAVPVVLAPPLITLLQQILTLIGTAATPALAPLTAPAAALSAQLAGIAAQNTKGL